MTTHDAKLLEYCFWLHVSISDEMILVLTRSRNADERHYIDIYLTDVTMIGKRLIGTYRIISYG